MKRSSKSKILYLGIDPSRFGKEVFHYPVIRTEKLPTGEAEKIWLLATHVLFTSQSARKFWPLDVQGKVVIAIGSASAAGIEALIPEEATQEGVIALLETLDLKGAFLFWPHSKRARPVLRSWLQKNQIAHYAFALYDTIFQKPEPAPSLDAFDEIVFTSPSTVEAFLQIYGKLPKDKILTPIGPVTKAALEKNGFSSYSY